MFIFHTIYFNAHVTCIYTYKRSRRNEKSKDGICDLLIRSKQTQNQGSTLLDEPTPSNQASSYSHPSPLNWYNHDYTTKPNQIAKAFLLDHHHESIIAFCFLKTFLECLENQMDWREQMVAVTFCYVI